MWRRKTEEPRAVQVMHDPIGWWSWLSSIAPPPPPRRTRRETGEVTIARPRGG